MKFFHSFLNHIDAKYWTFAVQKLELDIRKMVKKENSVLRVLRMEFIQKTRSTKE